MRERSRGAARVAIIAAVGVLLCAGHGAGAATDFDPLSLQRSAIHILLNHEDPSLRTTAAAHIARTDCDNVAEAVRALRQGLRDPSEGVAFVSAMRLEHFGSAARPATSELVELVESDQPRLQMEALAALGAIRPDEEGPLEAVRRATRSEHWAVRLVAAAAAIAITEEPEPYLPLLLEGLSGESEPIRQNAAILLGMVGSHAEEAIPALIEALDQGGAVGAMAAKAIGRIGRRPGESVDALLVTAEKGDADTRPRALSSLGSFPSEKERTVPFLLRSLEDGGPDASRALGALARLGYPPADLEDTLEGLIASDDWLERLAAYEFLAEVQNPPRGFLPLAAQTLAREEDLETRQAALDYVRALAGRPDSTRAALKVVTVAAEDDEVSVRMDALCALTSLAEGNEDIVVETLMEATRDARYEVMRYALERLADFGEHLGPEHVQRLEELRRRYPGSRHEAWDREYGLEPLEEVINRALNPGRQAFRWSSGYLVATS